MQEELTHPVLSQILDWCPTEIINKPNDEKLVAEMLQQEGWLLEQGFRWVLPQFLEEL
jgi:hypothetical protein